MSLIWDSNIRVLWNYPKNSLSIGDSNWKNNVFKVKKCSSLNQKGSERNSKSNLTAVGLVYQLTLTPSERKTKRETL